ncbi:MAG: DnaB-like helicase C-terminal domain-containing protein [Clostridium butyricum]
MYNKELLEKAKDKVKLLDYIKDKYEVKKEGKSYAVAKCPICGVGDHFIINAEENYYKSFTDCCRGGTIVDFLKEIEGFDIDEAINKTFELADMKECIQLKNDKTSSANNKKAIFNSLINRTHENVVQVNYFHDRGLSDEIIKLYKLGYSDEGFNFAISNYSDINEKVCDIYKYYTYYLPILDSYNNCNYFITRLNDELAPKDLKLNKTHNLSGKEVQLLNQRYIINSNKYNNEYIFIVEGIFDALSIEDLGYKAIALNSTSNVKKLINMIEKNKFQILNKTFIIVADNDEAGSRCKDNLVSEFKRLVLKFQVCELPLYVKDVNELLQKDKAKLEKILQIEVNKKKNEDFCINKVNGFLKFIDESKNRKTIKTGIDSIDKALGGGLYPGLYTIGAIPSLGKTTLIHQIADNIASQDIDVLYFSLEIGRNELMLKSISREMFLIDRRKAVTTREIEQGKFNYDVFSQALENYKDKIASNIAVFEGNFKTDINVIKNKVEANIKVRNKKPVVFIDYLQILKSANNKMNDKQSNDFNVTELKKLSRDYNIPVIVISSLNRANYSTSIGFESFKETGAIEYGSDAIIGLQLKAVDAVEKSKTESERRNKINDLKARNPRDIEFVVLKQRNGQAYSKCDLKYYTKNNYFTD